jgi:hypothetical protein
MFFSHFCLILKRRKKSTNCYKQLYLQYKNYSKKSLKRDYIELQTLYYIILYEIPMGKWLLVQLFVRLN